MDWIDNQLKRLDERDSIMLEAMNLKQFRGTNEHDDRLETLKKRLEDS